MNKYLIEVEGRLVYAYSVEAASIDEAKAKVQKMLDEQGQPEDYDGIEDEGITDEGAEIITK